MEENRNVSGLDDQTVRSRPASPEEIAYRDGYVRGKAAEEKTQQTYRRMDSIRAEQAAQARANEGASNGLLAGLLLAIIAACLGAAAYYLTREPQPAATEAPVERETTIIERTIENNREIIQNPPEVNLPDVQVPNVEINVPELPSAENTAPEPAAAEPESAVPAVEESAEAAPESEAVDPAQ